MKYNYVATWWVLIQSFTLLFHDILNVNNILYKFRVKVSPLCHFCMKILETSIYLFHICAKGCSRNVRKGCSPHLINHLSYTKECHLWTWWSWSKLSIDTPPSDFFQMLYYKDFKGYLHYKTLTSQNLSSEAQVKIFLFRIKIIFHSQDIHVFAF